MSLRLKLTVGAVALSTLVAFLIALTGYMST